MAVRVRSLALWFAVAIVGGFLLLQLVPYGRNHTNPPVVRDAPWPSGEARNLAVAACYDCHSNETEWPLYSYVAPMSWLVTQDVEAGRDEFNFSDWDEDGGDADDAAEVILDGSMPPGRYEPLHPDAKLSDPERRELVDALTAMEDDDDR